MAEMSLALRLRAFADPAGTAALLAGRGVSTRPPRPRPSSGASTATARALAGPIVPVRREGGRLTYDTSATYINAGIVIVPPNDFESDWRAFKLDSDTLDRASPMRLLQMLTVVSPDVSRALWDHLRLCNPGFELVAYQPGTTEVHKPGQAALDAFRRRLEDTHGSMDVVISRLFIGPFARGAFMGELVLDEAGREPLDLATPDPGSARFRRLVDPVVGTVYRLGQWQAGRFVELDRATIRYLPIDPFPGSPYGSPMAAPALFPSLFLLGLLHDLRRVVSQQGYPRIDLEINLEALRAAMPESFADDPEAFKDWINAVVAEVQKAYAALEPEDAYIHANVVKVNRPVGAVDSSSLGAVDGLIQGLERLLVRGLKTMPLLMGITDGVSEANANRQWEIYAAGIKSLQHYCETLLGRLFTLGLQAQGIQAQAEIAFAELRAAEEMRDQQTQALKNDNALFWYLSGWSSHEEASVYATGHPPDAPEPRRLPSSYGGTDTPSTNQNPEPGSARGRRDAGADGGKVVPDGARRPLPHLPGSVSIETDDLERAVREWDEAEPEKAGLLDAEVEGE